MVCCHMFPDIGIPLNSLYIEPYSFVSKIEIIQLEVSFVFDREEVWLVNQREYLQTQLLQQVGPQFVQPTPSLALSRFFFTK